MCVDSDIEFMTDCRDIRKTISYVEALIDQNQQMLNQMNEVGRLTVDCLDAFYKDLRNVCLESLLEHQLENWNHGA